MGLLPGQYRALVDPKEFAYQMGVGLRGYTVTKVPDGWRVVMRGNKRNGDSVYCLFVAVELETALEGLLATIGSKGGLRYWYKDKYA